MIKVVSSLAGNEFNKQVFLYRAFASLVSFFTSLQQFFSHVTQDGSFLVDPVLSSGSSTERSLHVLTRAQGLFYDLKTRGDFNRIASILLKFLYFPA